MKQGEREAAELKSSLEQKYLPFDHCNANDVIEESVKSFLTGYSLANERIKVLEDALLWLQKHYMLVLNNEKFMNEGIEIIDKAIKG